MQLRKTVRMRAEPRAVGEHHGMRPTHFLDESVEIPNTPISVRPRRNSTGPIQGFQNAHEARPKIEQFPVCFVHVDRATGRKFEAGQVICGQSQLPPS